MQYKCLLSIHAVTTTAAASMSQQNIVPHFSPGLHLTPVTTLDWFNGIHGFCAVYAIRVVNLRSVHYRLLGFLRSSMIVEVVDEQLCRRGFG